jgi:lipopolysaccharide assembly protein A
MKSLSNLVIAAIVATTAIATAIISVQNATLVNISWLQWQSIALPWGLVLTLAMTTGWMLGAVLPAIWRVALRQNRNRNR